MVSILDDSTSMDPPLLKKNDFLPLNFLPHVSFHLLLFLILPSTVSPLIQAVNFRFTLKLITPTNAPSTLIYNRSLMRFKPIKTANPINRRGLRLESSFTTRLSKFFFTQKPFENGFLWCCCYRISYLIHCLSPPPYLGFN